MSKKKTASSGAAILEPVVYQARGAIARLFVCEEPETMIHGPRGTGKTRGALEWANWLLEENPGARGFLGRKTRKSMTTTTLRTWEEDVLGMGNPMVAHGPTRRARVSYNYPNGSVLDIGGMDQESKSRGGDYDFFILDELTECLEEDWDSLQGTLRGKVLRRRFAVGCTNPGSKQFWAWRRVQAGTIHQLRSRFEDNPHATRDYIERLARLPPGPRRKWFYEGEWSTAQGVVWEAYDESVHLVSLPEKDGKPDYGSRHISWYFGAMDWGWRKAGCFGVFGVTTDGELYLVAHWYHTKRSKEWWAQQVLEAHREFFLQRVVCDPSDPASIFRVNEVLGYPTEGPGMIAVGAENKRSTQPPGDIVGIDLVNDYFHKKQLFICRDSLRHLRDPELYDTGKPWDGSQELGSYTWSTVREGRVMRETTDPLCEDHFCFVSGTPITLADGSSSAVERVKLDSRVWTPSGARGVVALGSRCADVVDVVLADGSVLHCSADHPFVVRGLGMVRADTLTSEMEVERWASTDGRRLVFSRVESGVGIRMDRPEAGRSTSAGRDGSFIAYCGRRPTARSRRATTSTTRTGIPATTTFGTWRPSRPANTVDCIASTYRASFGDGRSSGSQERSAAPAINAGVRCRRISTLEPDFALTPANPRSGGRPVSTMSNASARSAGGRSSSIGTRSRAPALVRVERVCAAGSAEVFNLTVEGAHVYLAGGILVSNCDMLRYGVSFAHGRDLTPDHQIPPDDPESYGALYNHNEVWEQLKLEDEGLAWAA